MHTVIHFDDNKDFDISINYAHTAWVSLIDVSQY